MFRRHFLALAITLSIYFIPSMLYDVAGLGAWVNSALWSCIYIVLVYKLARIRLMPLLLAAEFMALLTMLIAFIEHQIINKDWFFYTNYELIINACFAAELIIITVGVLNGGAIKRVQRIWHSFHNSDSHRRSFLFPSEKPV